MCRKLRALQWIKNLNSDTPIKEPHLVVLGHNNTYTRYETSHIVTQSENNKDITWLPIKYYILIKIYRFNILLQQSW